MKIKISNIYYAVVGVGAFYLAYEYKNFNYPRNIYNPNYDRSKKHSDFKK
jgi:hypothetical protein